MKKEKIQKYSSFRQALLFFLEINTKGIKSSKCLSDEKK